MCNSLQIEKKIVEYVQGHTFVHNKELANQTLLFKEGIFDSMSFVLLIDFIEENFNIKLTDKDLVEENFKSIDAITCYILNKKDILVPK